LNKEVEQMLEEAKAQDEEEDRLYGTTRRGDELPEELGDPGSRFARLKEAKARLEAKAKAEREEQEKRSGIVKKRRKRPARRNPAPSPRTWNKLSGQIEKPTPRTLRAGS
jgi:hypothetical protein